MPGAPPVDLRDVVEDGAEDIVGADDVVKPINEAFDIGTCADVRVDRIGAVYDWCHGRHDVLSGTAIRRAESGAAQRGAATRSASA